VLKRWDNLHFRTVDSKKIIEILKVAVFAKDYFIFGLIDIICKRQAESKNSYTQL
jgi:hypothetical protein